ncbi:MAG TPA: LysE family translocator [Herbaspirillum sp.]|uniref:LysE family translocator n=1 Tax=Herbaspirillum sp. TaxID=1890675 RepID=UPI002D454B78|nr:LysE family translocator [Herbaspirillum sp.]HZG21997.1 LysE family translocator [Herbaspirillum sp.]
MPLETLLLFVPACFALNMAFGPNNLLSITIGAHHGVRLALLAAVGRLAAFAIMIAVAAVGMGALLMASQIGFTISKLLGAAYLVWLGVKLLLSPASLPADGLAAEQGRGDLRSFLRREFLVAIGNPKAILVFTAFFPQFVVPGNYWGSFLTLGAIFLALEVVAIAAYAYAGSRLSGVIRNARGLRWMNRISGSTMIFFGALLALAKRPTV